MKNFFKKDPRGITLLEVIIACAILPVIIFAATSMMLGMARVHDKTGAGVDFLMTTDTLFLRFEKDLLNVRPQIVDTVAYPWVEWGAGFVRIWLSPTSGYRYHFGDRTLVNQATGDVYSGGVLLPDAPLEDYDGINGIDAVDIARRDNCLTVLTQAACHNLNVNAVFGVTPERQRVSFSFRSERQRENNQHGFTKDIFLAV